jgi:hypothetical protein
MITVLLFKVLDMGHPAKKIAHHHADLTTESSRRRLTKIVMRLLDEWDLKTAEELGLLGLRITSRNMLQNYRNLVNIIPYDQDKLERVGLLLSIYKNIYDIYPENEALRKSWVKCPNQVFDGMRPLDIMLVKGLFGMAEVLRFLDLQRST